MSEIERIGVEYRKKRVNFREQLFSAIYNMCGYKTINKEVTIKDGSVFVYYKDYKPNIFQVLQNEQVYNSILQELNSEERTKLNSLKEEINENLSPRIGINKNNRLFAFKLMPNNTNKGVLLSFEDKLRNVYSIQHRTDFTDIKNDNLKDYINNPEITNLEAKQDIICGGILKFRIIDEEDSDTLKHKHNREESFNNCKNELEKELSKFKEIEKSFKTKFKKDVILSSIT